jgi:transposase
MDTTALPGPDDEDAHTIGRKSARRPRIELITRGERRRIWTPEQKREIVLESLDPGTTPTAVARKHAISSGLLYTWRQRLLGVQGSPMVRSSPSFARVEVTSVPASLDLPDRMPPESTTSSGSASTARPGGLIEIVLTDGVLVRMDAHVDGRALRRVLGALEGR